MLPIVSKPVVLNLCDSIVQHNIQSPNIRQDINIIKNKKYFEVYSEIVLENEMFT